MAWNDTAGGIGVLGALATFPGTSCHGRGLLKAYPDAKRLPGRWIAKLISSRLQDDATAFRTTRHPNKNGCTLPPDEAMPRPVSAFQSASENPAAAAAKKKVIICVADTRPKLDDDELGNVAGHVDTMSEASSPSRCSDRFVFPFNSSEEMP
ncbi:hypothetical protein LZ30DRAFT_691700 [Colletotrichum cereale]|nr:hypothetical protein LZ30DRAFT_691700 [Colletotrichum cereale]